MGLTSMCPNMCFEVVACSKSLSTAVMLTPEWGIREKLESGSFHAFVTTSCHVHVTGLWKRAYHQSLLVPGMSLQLLCMLHRLILKNKNNGTKIDLRRTFLFLLTTSKLKKKKNTTLPNRKKCVVRSPC